MLCSTGRILRSSGHRQIGLWVLDPIIDIRDGLNHRSAQWHFTEASGRKDQVLDPDLTAYLRGLGGMPNADSTGHELDAISGRAQFKQTHVKYKVQFKVKDRPSLLSIPAFLS